MVHFARHCALASALCIWTVTRFWKTLVCTCLCWSQSWLTVSVHPITEQVRCDNSGCYQLYTVQSMLPGHWHFPRAVFIPVPTGHTQSYITPPQHLLKAFPRASEQAHWPCLRYLGPAEVSAKGQSSGMGLMQSVYGSQSHSLFFMFQKRPPGQLNLWTWPWAHLRNFLPLV